MSTEFDQSDVFREGAGGTGMFPDLDKPEMDEPPVKKKSTLLPMVAGIGLVVVVCGFGAWKVIGPHLHLQQSDDDLGPINSQQVAPAPTGMPPTAAPNGIPRPQWAPQQVAQQGTMGASPNAAPIQSEPSAAATALGVGQAPGTPTLQQASSQAPGNPVPQSVTGTSSAPSVQADAMKPASSQATGTVAPQVDTVSQSPSSQGAPTAEQRGAAPSDAAIVKLSARLDSLEESMKSLKAELDATRAHGKTSRSDNSTTTSTSVAAPQQDPSNSAKPHESRKAASKRHERSKPSAGPADLKADDKKSDSTAAADGSLKLKAVLEGRAWIQTKSGDTVTVSTGDQVVPGVTVKAIDVDAGEVRLSNGNVLR
ncbi:hypothetical protein [Paraburkholderia sediminicola]|uniref:hypothetical protein n=1 Tax=Paraburkholderia sediminicola TaxID=458836 RepID=UPI0038B9FD59